MWPQYVTWYKRWNTSQYCSSSALCINIAYSFPVATRVDAFRRRRVKLWPGNVSQQQPTSRHRRYHVLGCSKDAKSSSKSDLISNMEEGEVKSPHKWQEFVATPLYKYWLQGGFALLVLMLVDAAYSGDWSRIGAITRDTELQLQKVATAVGAVNLLCVLAGSSILLGQERGSWLAVGKCLFSGPLGLIEMYADLFDHT